MKADVDEKELGAVDVDDEERVPDVEVVVVVVDMAGNEDQEYEYKADNRVTARPGSMNAQRPLGYDSRRWAMELTQGTCVGCRKESRKGIRG